MEKRAGLIWRIAVALIVVISLAPIFVINGATADYEPTRPETYMDPFPAYMDDTLINALPWLTGTSIWGAEGRDVVEVDVQIQRNSDGYYWDDGTTSWAFENTWNPLSTYGTIIPDWISDQWAWSYTGTTLTSAFLDSGIGYTVRARAQDNQEFEDLTPAVRTFCYDDDNPDVSFSTAITATIDSQTNPLTEIKGTAHDDPVVASCPGTIDQTRVEIQDTDSGLYWNGHFWQTAGVWIKTQGTNSWSISTSTNPPLPQWKHNTDYQVRARTADKANNQDTEGWKPFLYQKHLTTSSCYLDPISDYGNAVTDFIVNGFSGTSMATGGQAIVDIRVRIVDTTLGLNNIWWNDNLGPAGWDTTFSEQTDWPNCPAGVIALGAYGQYDWTCLPAGITWTEGHTYQVTARATDNTVPTPHTYPSTSDSFKYDLSAPQSNIVAFAVEVRNTWNSLTGTSGDTHGVLGNVVVLIEQDPGGPLDSFWNGAGWGTVEWGGGGHWWDWIFATGGSGSASVTWSVTSTTTPKLPSLVNNRDYHIEVIGFDKAGNVETTAQKDFTFVIDMEVGTGYVPPATPTATSTEGTTEPGGPTNTSTGGGGTGATATATTVVQTPTPTYTYVPPAATATPTATTLPGFSGSANIGPSGGTVTANDGDGNPRVTASFEANALGASTDVSITGSGTCTGTAPEGYVFGNSCFDINPSQALGAMVEICVHYTAADLMAADGNPSNLRLAYKDSGGNWKVLRTTVEGNTICAETDHLSSWAVVGSTGGVTEGWEWWYYVGIGIGAALVLLLLVYLILRSRGGKGEGGEEGEGGEYGEGDYEEGEV